MRRLLLLGGLLAILVVAGVWATFARGGPPGGWRGDGPPWPFPLVPIVVVGTLLLLGGAARRSVLPLGEVMRAADRVAEGNYAARVRPGGPPDVRRLGHAFNTMAARLEVADTRRREFLADVAHELRTPLSVIRGNVEGILDGVYPPDRERLEAMLASAAVMTRLLDDLQLLSTAQAGVLRLHREPVDPAGLVRDVAARFRESGVAEEVEVTWQAPAGMPAVHADRVRLDQVLANLVRNALQHTPAGGSVVLRASSEEGGVRFAVTDSGRGIEPERLATVFERYERSDSSGGSGLGLAIARSLVEAHGGRIGADSRLGEGTTVWFQLPS